MEYGMEMKLFVQQFHFCISSIHINLTFISICTFASFLAHKPLRLFHTDDTEIHKIVYV